MSAPRGVPQVGSSDPRVREYLAARRGRTEDAARLVAAEGLWALRKALEAGVAVDVVFVSPSLVRGQQSYDAIAAAQARGAEVLAVSAKLVRRMVTRDGSDGLAALVRLRACRLDDIRIERSTRLLVVHGMELAGNLGSLVRSADAAGAAAVIFTSRRIRLAHPLAVKASMGTLFSMPLIDANPEEAITWLRARGVRMVAADPAATCSYRGRHYSPPVAVVVGGERHGLSSTWRSAASAVVSIPMLGAADSLNLGHAATLLLYEAVHHHG